MSRLKYEITGIFFAMTLLLGGCQGKNEPMDITADSTDSSSYESTKFEFVEDVELDWKDNSLDDWQAVINLPMEEVKAEGEQFGGRMTYVVGECGAVRFKNHLIGSYKKDWSGVNGITSLGEKFSKKITIDPEYVGMQIDLLGSVSGKKGYVASRDVYDEEYNVIGRWFYELDENFEKIHEFYVEHLTQEDLTTIMGDGKGSIHLIYMEVPPNTYKYVILSCEGKVVFESSGNYREGLRAFGEGRVAACEIVTEGSTMVGKLMEADLDKGILTEIGSLSAASFYNETDGRETRSYSVTPQNTKELIWCGNEGLYTCNSNGEETRMIYRWTNHGISIQGVADMYAAEDGMIEIIYKDDEGMKFLLLKPTEEKAEIKVITFAVTPFHKEVYANAVASFNKKYPTYNIEIKDDYDETSLLTQLGAGSGPVLVDTTLTGFEELEKLWQPMDGFLENSGLAEELISKALDFGKIENRTYGIVTNFTIRALAVADRTQTNWDYDGFLKSVESYSGAAFTATWFDTQEDEREYFFHVLNNGLDDNAYIDTKKGTTILESSEFERIVNVSEKAVQCPRKDEGKTSKEGDALCELLNVSGAEGLVRLRVRKESGENIMGYPTKNGAKYLLSAQSPITVRNTASDEEKRIAYSFFKILLSKDSAMASIKGNTYAQFSVRKDILEEQFNYYANVSSETNEHGKITNMPTLDMEKDRKFFDELINNSIVQKEFPAGLQKIFDEEIDDFLDGKIDRKSLYDHLKSRTWIYLEEQK